ncbi:hypothetical protein BLNAU_5483 [Blattamonas nauphoetae]|uniref:Uncharacterized protein n=1 Tax=Blattamonas nauphoetae TaxID=2049346 RepID=A0ABQ9Y6W0_9EUKA|nr:hypothetical protein BLNAU_5483 [Blattamonas nauphoetae]
MHGTLSYVEGPVDSIGDIQDGCQACVDRAWNFIVNLTFSLTDPLKPSFQTIILDDPSFPDLILYSLQLSTKTIRENTIDAITNIVVDFPWMKERFMTANLFGRMFETVNFGSRPLWKSETLYLLTRFIASMMDTIGDDRVLHFEQYPHIRVSVFEPAKHFITFMFHNSDKLILDEEDNTRHEKHLCLIHSHIKNIELRSDEHDASFVSELVKWEMRAMVEMENEHRFKIVFGSMLNRTQEWRRNKRERQKRREVCLREEGWDDALELRVVGIEKDTNQSLVDLAEKFRRELAFNPNRR